MCSSDDPLAVRGEIEAYQTQRTPRGRGVIIDLDESMESDDELMKDDDEVATETAGLGERWGGCPRKISPLS